MMQTLEQGWGAARGALEQGWAWVWAAAQGLSPLAWAGIGVALLLLLYLLLRRRPERAGTRRPEVLVSLGAISAQDGPDARGTLLPNRHRLKLTVSNLNAYPVQVLEIALKTPEMEVPATAEVAALVPPEGSVVIDELIDGVEGDEGRLNLYFYTAGGRKRFFRLQTGFSLEPWNARYKISPLNQSVAPAKQLASASVNRVRERDWREQEAYTRLPSRRDEGDGFGRDAYGRSSYDADTHHRDTHHRDTYNRDSYTRDYDYSDSDDFSRDDFSREAFERAPSPRKRPPEELNGAPGADARPEPRPGPRVYTKPDPTKPDPTKPDAEEKPSDPLTTFPDEF